MAYGFNNDKSKVEIYSKTEVDNEIGNVNDRIDNIITSPAPTEQEIIDARLGADGVTYPSLGDAIRDQVSDLKSDLNNIVDVSDYTWTQQGITDGVPWLSDTRILSDYIEVTEGTHITVTGNTNCLACAYFDSDYNYLSAVDWGTSLSVASGVRYVRVVIRKTSYNSTISADEVATQAARCVIRLRLNRGTVLLDYDNEDIGDIAYEADFASSAIFDLSLGGGVNALPQNWTAKQYITNAGAFNYSAGMWLSGYIDVHAFDSATVKYTYSAKSAVLRFAQYDSSKNYISDTYIQYTSSVTAKIEFASSAKYLRLSIGNWSTAYSKDEVVSAVSAIFNTNITELITPSIIGRCKDQIENIFAGCDGMRARTVAGTPEKNFALLMMTDTHGDTVRLQNAIDLLNGCSAIDACIHLGDIEPSNYGGGKMSSMVAILNKATKPLLTVMGNHDGRQKATTNCTVEQAVTAFQKATTLGSIYEDRGYAYYDFDDYNIRVIILNNFDYPNDKNGDDYVYYGDNIMFLQAQINWFISALNSTPSGYTVIVASHFAEPTRLDQNVINQHIGTVGVVAQNDTRGSTGYMGDTIIGDIINAFKAKSTLTKNYTYTLQGSVTGVSAAADFTARTSDTFACYICGHVHCQGIGHLWNYDDQVVYFNDSSCLYANDGTSMWTTCSSLLPRDPSGASQDLLTVLCVDTDNKMINLVRVGAYRNMYGDDSNFINYEY